MAAQPPFTCDAKALPSYVIVGRIVGPWGIQGKVKVESLTEFPQRLAEAQVVYLDHEPYAIECSRQAKGRYILKLVQIETREAAEALRGKYLEIPAQALEQLPEDRYYHFQILGLEVWTTQGRQLGKVVRIEETGSNDVYVVATEKGEVLIPAIEDVVRAVELPAGRLVIDPIEGLLD